MSQKPVDPTDAMALGRLFFAEVVRPAMAQICPRQLEAAACGRFGWGSECFGMDDAISRDHHWGPRVDILLPDPIFAATDARIWDRVGALFPAEFAGFH